MYLTPIGLISVEQVAIIINLGIKTLGGGRLGGSNNFDLQS